MSPDDFWQGASASWDVAPFPKGSTQRLGFLWLYYDKAR
jgi:hypothetical protein